MVCRKIETTKNEHEQDKNKIHMYTNYWRKPHFVVKALTFHTRLTFRCTKINLIALFYTVSVTYKMVHHEACSTSDKQHKDAWIQAYVKPPTISALLTMTARGIVFIYINMNIYGLGIISFTIVCLYLFGLCPIFPLMCIQDVKRWQ